jgi:hypothetical protein
MVTFEKTPRACLLRTADKINSAESADLILRPPMRGEVMVRRLHPYEPWYQAGQGGRQPYKT